LFLVNKLETKADGSSDLALDESGIARRGLLIRHLVLPHDMAGTRDVMRFIASRISRNSYVNIMSQYRPCGRASEVKPLAASLSQHEFEQAQLAAGNQLEDPAGFVMRVNRLLES